MYRIIFTRYFARLDDFRLKFPRSGQKAVKIQFSKAVKFSVFILITCVVDFSKLFGTYARIDSAIEGVVGGFDDASCLAVAQLCNQISDSDGFASSADLNFEFDY